MDFETPEARQQGAGQAWDFPLDAHQNEALGDHMVLYYRGLNNYQYYFGGSLL